MRDLIAELQGMAPAGRQGGMRDLIAEMGEEPLRPNYGRDNKPDYWQEQLKPSLIETGKAAARVTGATLGGLAMMPFAGIAGLGKTIISGLDEGGKTLEEIGGIPGRLISTPEEAQSIETIGKAMEPFHMAGEGLKEIVRLTPAKDTILEPIVGTIGEVSAMFALPGVPKTAKAWWDKLPHRKRVMVVDQVKADIASGQFTSAEIREMWKDPANREALLKRYQGVGEEGGTMRQPSRPTNPPDSGRALPEGQGFELRPRPGEIRDIIAEMGKEGPKALPPGQGFELRPTAAEVRDIIAEMGQSRPALPYPEGVGEGFVSKPGTTEAPIVTKAGDPFKTEKTAEKAGDKQGLDWNLYEVTQQEGGFAITRKMGREIRPVSPKPESILDMIRKDKVVETGESPEVASLTQKLTSTEAWLRKNAAFKGTPMYDVNIQVAEAARGKLSDLGIEIKPPPETAQPGAIVKAAIPEGQGTDMPEIVQPRADAVWQRQREKIENAQNIIGFIQASGGMDLTGWDYPPDRHPDLRRVHKKGASSPDVVAETLKDEGFTGFEDANDLLDKIASGNARNIFTPGKQDVMIERQLRREQNEWIEGRLADLEVEGIDAGTAREIIPNHKSRALDEIRSERLIDPANEEAALKEVEDFFSEVTSQKAATPKGDFKTADLNPSRPPEVGGQSVLSNQRGSIPIAESEILQAILKTRGKIEEAMPHLEALGRSVYEGGKQRFLDWQAAMKGKLGDLWEGFKAKMRAVWEGVTKPLMNEKGAVDVAPAVKAVKEVKDVMAEGRKIADEYLGAISTRLGNIDPSLKNTMRKLEFRRGMKATESTNRVMPFIKKADKMNKADKAAFDLARKNGDPGKLKELVIKYNLGKEYHELRNVLKELYDEATAVGYDVGYRPNYHPRVLKDTKGFLEYFYKKADWPILEQAIREQEVKLQRYLTEDEKAKLINGMLRGYPSGQISLSKPGQLKGRSVEHITPELNEFYMDSDAALIQYISDVTDAVEARKLFGVGKKGGKVGDLNDTIGGYVLKLLQEGKIKPQQEQVLKDILAARFNEVGTRGLFSLYKNVSYIDTMGSPISAITQIGDLAWALYKNGPWQTVKATTQATVGRSMFKKEDLGIGRVAEEFSDQTKMARAVSKTFDLIGLTKIDNIGKEALINSTYAKARQQAMTDKGTAALRKELEPIFEGETGQLIKDLRTGKITENVKLYLFNVLSDFQPISLSEMPQQYLTGGNGRIFYMLKTFTLKQFDAFRREAFQKIATEGQRTQGIKNLVHLAACFAVANASADFIKDLILGRPINIEDKVVDNMLRLVGISKFVTWKAREEGVGSASVRQIMPPFKAVDALSKDINSAGDEKGLEITQSIPVVGKLYYWWFGKGAEKSERKAAGMGKLVEPKGLAGLK